MRRAGRIGLGVVAIGGVLATALLGLVFTPADVVQQDAVRLLYLHVPLAWVAMYVSFGVTTLASIAWLVPRTRHRRWDLVAGASAEIGLMFLGLTLVIGSIWGRTTWGVWWTWDARLTTTAVLFVLYAGYLALRRVPSDPVVRARRCAIAALAAFVDVPLVHLSVEWWRTLHQKSTLLDRETLLHPHIHGLMWWTVIIGLAAFTALYAWLLIHRYDLAVLEADAEDRVLEDAIAARRAEGATTEPAFT